MQALLMLVPSPEGVDDDDFSLEHGEIRRAGPYRYTGLQVVRTLGIGEMPDTVFSLNAYWNRLAASGRIHGCVYDGQWCDVGTPAGLAAAERMLVS